MRAPHSGLNGSALLLAGGLCLVPFLLPRHLPPLRTFYDEWLAFGLGLAALALVAAAPGSTGRRVPTSAALLALFAITLFTRALGDQSAYPQSPLVWGLYLTFASLILVLGQDLAKEFGTQRVCDVLAAFVLAGALANSVCAVVQTIGVPTSLSDFVSHRAGRRAIGNIGQANLYSNYLALGVASIVYLYARGRVGIIPAYACLVVLAASASLAASRASLLYAASFALLGFFAMRMRKDATARRLGIASLVAAACTFFAQWAMPAGMNAFGYQIEGGLARNAPTTWEGPLPDEAANLRLSAWSLAFKLFQAAPWMGVGPDEFAGAAFAHGLPPELAGNQLWTSPHNAVFHLLSETGLVGAALVGAALIVWLNATLREFFRVRDASLWWILACTGVELLHALLEYPLWYAHFLALTALFMGLSATGGIRIPDPVLRAGFGLSALAGAILLALTLGAYQRFDLASPVAAGRSLAGDSEIARDRASLAELGSSLLAPRAETWLFQSFPLDTTDLPEKLAVGRRVMRVWPSREVAGRQSVFLALAGREDEARALLAASLKTFPSGRKTFTEMIESAPRRAREVLSPVLEK